MCVRVSEERGGRGGCGNSLSDTLTIHNLWKLCLLSSDKVRAKWKTYI